MTEDFLVLIFYKYISLEQPEEIAKIQRKWWIELNLKGRLIVSQEGLNGTLEGRNSDVLEYIKLMKQNPLFADIYFKTSPGIGKAFPRISIKVRPEIVSLHLGENNFDPRTVTGKYLKPEELNAWFTQNKKFYIIDMRNDYEWKSGHFKDSVLIQNLKNFRDLPAVLPEISHLKNETVLTVCTSGVRCEKASGFLMKHGFTDVYQLYGGIMEYMRLYPNQDFLGKLYVFDERMVIGFNTDSPEHQIIGRCSVCQVPSENYVNFYAPSGQRNHDIVCPDCLEKGAVIPDTMSFPFIQNPVSV